jgi:hypothetical protein
MTIFSRIMRLLARSLCRRRQTDRTGPRVRVIVAM